MGLKALKSTGKVSLVFVDCVFQVLQTPCVIAIQIA